MNRFKPVIIFSLLTFLLFSLTDSSLNILTQVGEQHRLPYVGSLLNLCNCLASAFGCLFSPLYLATPLRFGTLMLIGALGYALNISCGVLISQSEESSSYLIGVIVVCVSLISGVLVSTIFMIQGMYVAIWSDNSNSRSYFGISYAIIQSSSILGNVSPQFLIISLGQSNYFLAMTASIAIIGLAYFFLLPDTPRQKKQLFSLKQIRDGLFDRKFYTICPMIIAAGLTMSFIYTQLGTLVWLMFPGQIDEEVNSLTFRVLMFLGIGQFIGGNLISRITQRVSNAVLALILLALLAVSLLGTFTASMLNSYLLICAAAFLWGVVDCCLQSLSSTMIGQRFRNPQLQFALYSVLLCLSADLGYLLSMNLGTTYSLYLLTYATVVLALWMLVQKWQREIGCDDDQ